MLIGTAVQCAVCMWPCWLALLFSVQCACGHVDWHCCSVCSMHVAMLVLICVCVCARVRVCVCSHINRQCVWFSFYLFVYLPNLAMSVHDDDEILSVLDISTQNLSWFSFTDENCERSDAENQSKFVDLWASRDKFVGKWNKFHWVVSSVTVLSRSLAALFSVGVCVCVCMCVRPCWY
jgi:hypothetical protein